MHFLKLTVDNFGVFRGKHSFNLAPYFDDKNHAHPLTLFSGHNGAGKTTLFQAMMLALHGPASLGDRVSSQEYNHFIQGRMHRPPDAMNIKAHSDFAVALSFQYVQSGQCVNIEAVRRWQKHGHNFRETFTVLQDGQPPDIDSTDHQAWLNDFISPGFGSLCFFDAEQLDSLANPEQQNKVLKETLERLLGLDLVQRLQLDLEQLLSRHGSTARIDNLYTKVLELRSAVEELADHLTTLRKALDEIGSDLSSCEAALAQLERQLAAEGGAYAAKRPLLQEQLIVIKKEAETLANQLHDLCGDLLPFALVPELCLEVSKRLAREIEIRQQKTLSVLWQERLPAIEELLVPGIVGMGKAAEIARGEMKAEEQRLSALRDLLWEGLQASIEGVQLNGHPTQRLPHNLNVYIPNVKSRALVVELKHELAISTGSACTTTRVEPSHVILALGYDKERAERSVRFGLGRGNTEAEVQIVVKQIAHRAHYLKRLTTS